MFDNSFKRKAERLKSSNKVFNLYDSLILDKKIDKEFFQKLKFLTIEELISLKLLSASVGLKGKLLNFPLIKFISDLSKEACVVYALSSTDSKKDASMILGITKKELNRLIKLFNIDLKEIKK